MKILNRLFILSMLVIFASCSDDDDGPTKNKGDFDSGMFVVNEGPFNNGSGTITHINDEGLVSQNIYKSVNQEDLGNIVQSMTFEDDKAYIVVNNSQKIVVANRYTFEKEAEITGNGISNPRYFVASNKYGFVSNWGDPINNADDFISVIDLATNEVLDQISVGEGPENMLINNGILYVNLEGGWSQNNKVVLIDVNDFTVIDQIEVGDVPKSIVEDNQGNVWVLCGGSPNWTGNETSGKLVKIEGSSKQSTHFDFSLTDHPENLSFDNGSVYYNLNGKVFEMGTSNLSLPIDPINNINEYFYAMSVNDGLIYGTDAKDYASEGDLKVFDATSGALIETVVVGIVPGEVVFQ